MSLKAEQKEKSHGAILSSAVHLLMERGIRASSVMDVMKGAGLTVGGFYGHFDSKEELFRETIRKAARTRWTGLVDAAKKGTTVRERVGAVVARYLSKKHRDTPTAGCPLPSIASDLSRQESEPYRAALVGELDAFMGALANVFDSDPQSHDPQAREKAVVLFAMMYGALAISRAAAGSPLSDEFLEVVRTYGETKLAASVPPP